MSTPIDEFSISRIHAASRGASTRSRSTLASGPKSVARRARTYTSCSSREADCGARAPPVLGDAQAQRACPRGNRTRAIVALPCPKSKEGMAAALHAKAEEAHGAVADPQDNPSALSVPAGQGSHPAVNPILRGWVSYFAAVHDESVLHLHRLGREEGAPASDAQLEAPRLRLATVASRLVVRHVGALLWLPGALQGHDSGPSTMSLITLGVKGPGTPSAGNRHARCDVAGTGSGLTVWLLRHSQRKRGANG